MAYCSRQLTTTDMRRSSHWSHLLEQRVAGLITVGFLPDDQVTQIMAVTKDDGTPWVSVDERSLAGIIDCVATDDFTGALQAVQHLTERGRRRIAHLVAETDTSTARDRKAGYEVAMSRASINLEYCMEANGSLSPAYGLEIATQLLTQARKPEAVFTDSDYLATAIIRAASSSGLRIPSDIALVGYGDIQVAEWLNLTTVNQHPEEMGARAIKMLFERIKQPDASPHEVLLPVELVIRGSSG